MKSNNILFIVALAAVVVAVLSAGVTYYRISVFDSRLTGLATDSGYINLSVESVVSVNFTSPKLNWSSGRVDPGFTFATFNTSVRGAGNVTNGNWSSPLSNTANALIIQNLGTVNATLAINFSTDAAGLLGGTSPQFRVNVSNNESGSCTAANGSTELGFLNLSGGTTFSFTDANITGQSYCPILRFEEANDELRVDISMVIPQNSKKGQLNSSVIITFFQA
jgi:hypothetical protein